MAGWLPLTLRVVAGRGCDCARQEDEGGEINEVHCDGLILRKLNGRI